MSDWFTVEPIDAQTFAISEYKHWEETHCYLLYGRDRAVLIDTGLGVSDIKSVVDRLTKLPVTVLTTHAHWDHIGGHRCFGDIAVHALEKDWLCGRFPLPLPAVKCNLTKKPCDFPPDFDLDAYQIFQGKPQRLLHGGELLDLGGRTLKVLHTPGHSPGHCCFYESERKYLFSGDLLYKGCLYAFYPTTDPQLFYRSVKTVQQYEVGKILPGHHALDIPVSLMQDIAAGFARLAETGQLKQGAGLFSFGDFQIQI